MNFFENLQQFLLYLMDFEVIIKKISAVKKALITQKLYEFKKKIVNVFNSLLRFLSCLMNFEATIKQLAMYIKC